MIKKTMILLSLIIILSSVVLATDAQTKLITEPFPFYRTFTELSLDVSGNVTLTGSLGGVVSAEIVLSQYPREDENIFFKYFNPNPDISYINETALFEYNKNQIEHRLGYVIHSGLVIHQNRPIIRNDPAFPISSIPNEFSKYLQSTNKVIISEDISNKATELVEGSEGLFEASFKIGQWVNENIEYSICPETETVVQDSEWVYDYRIGVCDEITTLFLAMTRAVSIPSRFVSGLAFTDITKDFGNHAWAEVYFPEIGWVPFDVTYGEFGWVDSNHIILSKSEKVSTNSVNVRITGGDIDIDTSELDFEVEVREIGDYDFPNLEISIETLSSHITPGSYNIIEAIVKNNKAGFQAVSLQLSNVNQMDILDNTKQFLLLPPYNKRSVRWIIRVNESLNEHALHKFPLQVSTNHNISAQNQFNVSTRGIKYSKSFIDNMFINEANSNIKSYSKNVEVLCDVKERYFTNEVSTLDCQFKNKGDKELKNLKSCILGKCKLISLEKNSEKNINFDVVFNDIGLHTYILNVSNTDIQKTEYINFNVVDIPQLNMGLGYPEKVEFSDEVSIKLNLTSTSYSRPLNLKLDFKGSGIEKNWDIEKMNIDQFFVINGQGKNLDAGLNSFRVYLTWIDEKGREYSKEETFEINLQNLNLWQKMYVFINSLIKQ